MNQDEIRAIALATQFHELYESLAPSFGYETRQDTRQFDPESKNGRLMVAVCGAMYTRFLAAIAEKAEPDCWAVLTPNGSKLVSPQEAKGLLKAYPLFTHPAIEPAQDEKLRFALENCRLLAARHRKEDWALLILGFCSEGGVAGSPLRDGGSK